LTAKVSKVIIFLEADQKLSKDFKIKTSFCNLLKTYFSAWPFATFAVEKNLL